ncbi:Cyclin PHO80-like protein [Cordyceps fumosorosea ARSEF 2679]|uniref:Cyclin PHO80-like protein n=1 Tax=Cordyceps fumosorosea (strain ARSEF 2679) TaxID=1081104 RepID=A0A167ZKJ6_CORFA|nr:Cyclin PHO80-like protein [Cordyceps fumosorosea ARSEF 2679]OAA67626.1 Cyclin PHO80-like protein [Cordyceps fumosorosea ARSEF 2679]
MPADNVISPTYISSVHNQYATYNNILTSSVSTTNSTWSDTSSQSSDDTSISSTSDSDSCDPYYRKPAALAHVGKYQSSLTKPIVSEALPKELRQNPRRSGPGSRARGACPPALVRQCDRKVNFVDSLVDSSTQIVEAIWPLSSAACRSELGSKAVLPLRTFIQETLRRSRTSYSTLQVALYYLILIKPHVPKYNFTMEQPEDRHADRALQCGRRMFLAALILASKYLQDRNYSARAWSKISGLNTHEINQNEISFLLAVNWKLHIADEVFQRWTEIVLKYTPPPSPPSPSATSTMSQQSIEWRNLILRLNPELTNIEGLFPLPSTKPNDLCAFSLRNILNPSVDSRAAIAATMDVTAPKAFTLAPVAAAEPMSTPAYSAGGLAPALGLLPTPRLTPQTNGLCTPVVSVGSYKKPSAMCLAMAQASSVTSAHHLDRLPISSVTSSPQSYCPARRSSLANSVSTASSPESMISDVSRSSRSSSISSISSLASAGVNSKLMTSRFRGTVAKAMNERSCQKPTVPSVPEDFDEHIFSSSPESYTGPVTKLDNLSLDTPLARREEELEELMRDPVYDAARTLQNLQTLHNEDIRSADSTPTARVSRKRTRPSLVDDFLQEEGPLQENVRHLLHGKCPAPEPTWKRTPHKRLCCSTEAASGFLRAADPRSVLHQGQGIWDGILN